MPAVSGANLTNLNPAAITGLTASAAELNILDGATLSTAELNILDGVTLTASQINDAARQSAENTFTGATQTLSSVRPSLRFTETDAAANAGKWNMEATGGVFVLETLSDAGASGTQLINATRSGNTASLALNGTSVTLNSVNVTDFARLSQNNTFTGTTQVISGTNAQLQVTNGTATLVAQATGSVALVGTSGAHPLDFYTSGTQQMRIDASGNYDFKDGTVTTTNSSASEVGYNGVPQNRQDTSYTCVLSDANKHILAAGSSGQTYTIPANASVAYPLGTTLTFMNVGTGGTQSIAITSDVLALAGAGLTGTRTLADYGVATAVKVASTTWVISGVGLS